MYEVSSIHFQFSVFPDYKDDRPLGWMLDPFYLFHNILLLYLAILLNLFIFFLYQSLL